MMRIRDIGSEDLRLFGDIIARLERLDDDLEVREMIFPDIMRLLRADFGASYIWNDRSQCFEHGMVHNITGEHNRRYHEWYQFKDPISLALRRYRKATLVERVASYSDLSRTEFYNDFLKRDGLHHGVNLFLFDGNRDLGDFRLWRAQGAPEFSERDTLMLDAIAPYLEQAIIRSEQRFDKLTARERQIAFLVARGCRDRDICDILGIGFGTVRIHINNAMAKKGCSNRAELAVAITRGRAGPN